MILFRCLVALKNFSSDIFWRKNRGVTRHGVTRHGVTRHGVTRHGVTRRNVTRHTRIDETHPNSSKSAQIPPKSNKMRAKLIIPHKFRKKLFQTRKIEVETQKRS